MFFTFIIILIAVIVRLFLFNSVKRKDYNYKVLFPMGKDLKKMEILSERESNYLDKNIFYGLPNINTGFDSTSIKYFAEDDFEIVLNRIKEKGLGIYGIEPWENGEYYGVMTYEEFTSNPFDTTWYINAFNEFKTQQRNLMYAASYAIPEEYL